MRRVKIVATIGPRTSTPDMLHALWVAGMDIARLNGSHSTLDWHANTIALLREVVPDVPVLLDIPGRKVRLGKLDHEQNLAAGELIVLTTETGHGGRSKTSVTYTKLHDDLTVGDAIIVDDSTLRFTVIEIKGQDLVCRIETNGKLQSGKGIHVPGVRLQAELLSERDHQLIKLACQKEVDFIGLSFVESPADVETVREIIGKQGPQIVSKVETQPALDRLSEVVKVSDALMIDRGDLSAETNLESVALFQKHILMHARRAACPVIVATEMMQTMIDNPYPTKAEVSDITNAVLDGATALMLSGETAVGKYPVEVVALMRKVADRASEHLQELLDHSGDKSSDSVPQVIGEAIELICRRLEVTKIVAITISGYAARMIAARKPRQPILAVSNNRCATRRFNILPGTKGIYADIPFSRTSMEHIPLCLELLWRQGELVDEDLILITAVGYPKSGNRMNLIETHKVADLRGSLEWVK